MKEIESALAALKAKVDHCVIEHVQEQESSISVKSGKIENAEHGEESSCAIAAWSGKKKGIVHAQKISEQIIEKASMLTKASAELEYFYGLPKKGQYRNPQLWDQKISDLTTKSLQEEMGRFLAQVDSSISVANAEIKKTTLQRTLVGSNGVTTLDRQTMYSVMMECVAKDGGQSASAWDAKASAQWFDGSSIVKDIARKASDFLHPQKITALPDLVALSPQVFASLLAHCILPNFDGKEIEKERSIFCNKKGGKIVHPSITLIDDGTIDWGMNSSSSDFEGTPCQKTALISEGVLRNFLYDYNTALHAKAMATGNATESGIEHTNVLVLGNQGCADRYILIESVIGAHTSNPTSTSFSVTVDKAYLVEKEKKIPLAPFMISGALIDILSNEVQLFGEEEQHDGIYTQTVLCKGISVIL